MSIVSLSAAELRRVLSIRDLTDPEQGPHAMQLLVQTMIEALVGAWGADLAVQRASPIVSVADNYDRLLYPADAVARDARYTRYVCEGAVLRTQTSAVVPPLLAGLAKKPLRDVLLVCPGIVYRRDSIDRLHSGEPHQVDLWRIRRGSPLRSADLEEMVRLVVQSALPGAEHRTLAAEHPYTAEGLQIDVRIGDRWIEIGECGLANPRLLADSGHDARSVSGLAMGIGLDRLLMLRKAVPDIRLLRVNDARISSQMLDLSQYRPVSHLPAVVRDLSLVVDHPLTAEEAGDRVREALGPRADAVEAVEIVSDTRYDELPGPVVERLGLRPGQRNLLVRVVLRDLEVTLTSEQANELRDRIYATLHRGERWEWASRRHSPASASGQWAGAAKGTPGAP
jgi:phenylalanyl-tRNA synthetase alpha chain